MRSESVQSWKSAESSVALAGGDGASKTVNLRLRAQRAGVMGVLHHGTATAIRVAAHLVLARLLAPDIFGLMAIVTSTINLLELFSDLGIGQKIVQSPRGMEAAFLNTAWTLKVVRGIALSLIAAALAWPAAVFYGQPALQAILPVIAIGPVLRGLASTAPSCLERRLTIGRLIAVQLGCQTIAALVTIAWAWKVPSVWALVAGNLAGDVLWLLGSYVLSTGHRPSLHWDPSCAREIIHFGRWLLPSTMLYFVLFLADRLILGLFVTPLELGLFSIGLFVGRTMFELVQAVSGRVLFPICAELVRSPGGFSARLARLRSRVLVWALPPLCIVIAWGPDLIALLYDDRYQGAGWMVRVLAAGSVIGSVNTTAIPVLLASGDSRRYFWSLAGGTVLYAAGLALGHVLGGWEGVVVAIGAVQVVYYPCLAWALRRHQAWQPKLDAALTLGAAGLAGFLLLMRAVL